MSYVGSLRQMTEIGRMNVRVTWFPLGAVSASIVWLVVLATVDQQLLQTFFGFAGH